MAYRFSPSTRQAAFWSVKRWSKSSPSCRKNAMDPGRSATARFTKICLCMLGFTQWDAGPGKGLAQVQGVEAGGRGLGAGQDRKGVVKGKSVTVGVDLGGRRCIKKQKTT